MVEYVNQNKDKYDQILITRNNGRPAMYYWFYSKTDPNLVQKWENLSPKDQGEFLRFKNIYFGIEPEKNGKQLIVTTTKKELTLLKEIKDLADNETIFYIYED